MKTHYFLRVQFFMLAMVVGQSALAEESTRIDRGRYLVRISGCNDCHTPGYAPSGGTVPESEWLKGDVVGWKGPWGTTYPINLRKYTSALTEDQWVTVARTVKSRPPMPWWALQHMEEQDLRDMYAYIRSLPVENGEDAPAYLSPEKEPVTPYFTMVMPVEPKEAKK